VTPERWQQVTAIFHAALGREASARVRYLDEACAGDGALRAEVDAMIAAHSAAGSSGTPLTIAFTEMPRLASGTTIGAYRVEGLIGAGGMGEVHRATDTKFNRPVAIKFLSGELVDSSARHRFQREAQTTSSLNHPHILTVHDVGEFEGRQYLVTEFVDGGTLREWAQRERRGWRQILELMVGVADGLAAAHQAGILHRDIKPENILITTSGYAKLADFGLAKLQQSAIAIDDVTRTATENRTRPGGIIGTVAYMSPEQASGRPLDARSDIFSFGVVLYELLAGRRPFAGASDLDVLHAVVHSAVESLPPEVPLPLRGVVEKALEKDPADRYQSMRDLVVDLRRLTRQTGEPVAPVAMRPKRAWKWATAVGTTVIAAAIVTWSAIGRTPTRPAPGAGASQIRTIAVLPLRNISGDPEQQYFADGMTEVLTTSLAQISALNVIARTSAMRYQGTQKTTREIAQELHVDAFVEGAAQRSGDRVLITAQLIDASNDRHLWAKSYERNLRDMLALQNEVAHAIAQEIQVTLTPQEQAHLTDVRPVNPEAQEAYLRGRYWDQKGPSGFRRSFDYLQQAVAKDPGYAPAYAALSVSYGHMIDGGLLPAKEAYVQRRAAITKALELDRNLADAYYARGTLHLDDWNWQEAERDFQKALQLNPNLAAAHESYAQLLDETGRLEEAATEARRVVQLDPFSGVNFTLAHIHLDAGRNDEALELGRTMLDVNVNIARRIVGLAYIQKGTPDLAIAEFQQVLKSVPQDYPSLPDATADLAQAYAASGRRREALQLLSQVTEMSKRRPVPSAAFARIYVALGDKDRAFEWLEKGLIDRTGWMITLKVDHQWDPLRSDPRYRELLRRMGLPQ